MTATCAASASASSLRRCSDSCAILPEHSTRRLTAPGSAAAASSITDLKDPDSRSPSAERDACARSIDFGVTTTNGRLGVIIACDRSRWKYWADVDGIVTRMLLRADSDKKR